MKKIELISNAKINFGLFIKGKRPDGYHELETVFLPIDLSDELELIENQNDKTEIIVFGEDDLGKTEDNLCFKAWLELKNIFPQIPFLTIKLNKKIPTGAGLGGGSSNAAFVLKGINEMFDLGLNNKKLEEIGVKLGADVPFFIENKPVLAKGIGEIFEPISLNFKYKIEIITPKIHSNTALAYKNLDYNKISKDKNLRELIEMSKFDEIINDFEPNVFERYPILKEMKDYFLETGALYASMSGSGSAIYGMFLT